MPQIIPFFSSASKQSRACALQALIASFALHRRTQEDVFWLKENAELLNILECTGADLPGGALEPLLPFYEGAARHISFFRQYYRFILSICLDLEDLGMPGQTGSRIAEWVAQQGLAQAELSDLQRAEARRLLARRGVLLRDEGLDDRLRSFISRPQTFAVPNKKAAYELTHIVFYLSEYGRRDPALPEAAEASLEFAGLVAFLDQNADLLAEICIALRFAGVLPPAEWEAWLDRQVSAYMLAKDEFYGLHDAYHEYFVVNWLMLLSGRKAFRQPVPLGGLHVSALQGGSILRSLSEAVFDAGSARASWSAVKAQAETLLSDEENVVLAAAERSCARFAGFFEGFARAGSAGAA
ncbi:hypothetical protein RA19_06875 [Leisingera sp. ANG-M1]|uniref:DUF6902 family protein n=1 Tax=Leisingera sp. ANG-M1 TaxID=1577895 RepID=UPI00057DFD18|nr:hypothetical protein [Leisingera sp. ANG-M1]KIC11086.1 hypothetical protein RA19_06875 [Leisingera sp. ANG-M1]